MVSETGRDRVRRTANAVADVTTLPNDAVIIRLHFTPNHLSRWLTPIHDQSWLGRSQFRGEPSVKDLLLELRNEELRIFPLMHEIAIHSSPDLDRMPNAERSEEMLQYDEDDTALQIMAEFRRLRQSSCSLLRSLPDGAWRRVGTSRHIGDWTIRRLAEHLVNNDAMMLKRLDVVLGRGGLREEIATVSRAPVGDLLRLAPSGDR